MAKFLLFLIIFLTLAAVGYILFLNPQASFLPIQDTQVKNPPGQMSQSSTAGTSAQEEKPTPIPDESGDNDTTALDQDLSNVKNPTSPAGLIGK